MTGSKSHKINYFKADKRCPADLIKNLITGELHVLISGDVSEICLYAFTPPALRKGQNKLLLVLVRIPLFCQWLWIFFFFKCI